MVHKTFILFSGELPVPLLPDSPPEEFVGQVDDEEGRRRVRGGAPLRQRQSTFRS